jgi:hypothetical protein
MLSARISRARLFACSSMRGRRVASLRSGLADCYSNQIGRILGPELLHDMGTVNFEGARADSQLIAAPLVRRSAGDKRENLSLPWRQAKPVRYTRNNGLVVCRFASLLRRFDPVAMFANAGPHGCATQLLQYLTDTLRFAQRILDHVANGVGSGVPATATRPPSLDLVQIDQQCGQRLIELMRDQSADLVHRQDLRRGDQVGLQLTEFLSGVMARVRRMEASEAEIIQRHGVIPLSAAQFTHGAVDTAGVRPEPATASSHHGANSDVRLINHALVRAKLLFKTAQPQVFACEEKYVNGTLHSEFHHCRRAMV